MSNTLSDPSENIECTIQNKPCSAILQIIEAKEKDLGGFSVRRLLPNASKKMIGPWIFFDHMGPAIFTPGTGIDVRPHPHINLATVTYLFAGEILHRDSLGNHQTITPGDINLMVAGSGIVHSERERDAIRNSEHQQHGLQLWLALPEANEEQEPAFYHYPKSDIPALEIEGATIRVMMGTAYGVCSPVKTFANTLYLEIHLPKGKKITLPDANERAVYLVEGELTIDGKELSSQQMAILSQKPNILLTATADSRIAVVGGEPLGERFIEWNFISSRYERIEQAKQDWLEQRFDTIPGDESEFIPLPKSR